MIKLIYLFKIENAYAIYLQRQKRQKKTFVVPFFSGGP